MVSVPRSLLEEACNGLRITQDRARKELRALLAQPSTQHQGEPVKTPARDESLGTAERDEYANGYRHGWNAYNDEMAKLGPLYTRPAPVQQSEPVAFYREFVDGREYCEKPFTNDWTPLYTHADPNVRWKAVADEQVKVIDALRADLESVRASRDAYAQNAIDLRESMRRARKAHGESQGLMQEQIDALRAQLAERDALLRDINKRHSSGVDFDLPADLAARVKALSASAEPIPFPGYPPVPEDRKLPAEPSAPVERDELEAEAQRIYESWSDQPGYVPWVARGNSLKQDEARRQARAALERKP